MADLLADVAAYLAAQGAGVVATDLFAGRLPDAPDTAVALLSYPGEPGLKTMTARPMEFQRFQAIARGPREGHTAVTGRIGQVYDVLDGLRGTTIAGTRYQHFEALQPPFKLDEDTQARPRWVCNFRVARARV